MLRTSRLKVTAGPWAATDVRSAPGEASAPAKDSHHTERPMALLIMVSSFDRAEESTREF
jgi:hypothetical protein